MIFLTFLSFLQMFVLPGLIFFCIFHPKKNYFFQTVFLTFTFSLFFNYAIVTLLVLFNIYSQMLLFCLTFVELIVVAAIQNPKKSFFPPLTLEHFSFDFKKFTDTLFIFSIFFVVFYYSVGVMSQVPKIFSAWDDVVSWNRWASSFAHGSLPLDTGHYPQALPAQWSLCYVFYGCDLEYLPKATVPLYLFSLITAICERGRLKKSIFQIVSALLILYFFNATGFVNTGYVDIPCAVIAFSSVFFLEVAIEENDKNLFIISAFISVLAGLVKQSGLFVTVLFPILALIFFFKDKKLTVKSIFVLLYALVFLCTTGIFYFFVQRNIISGQNTSEISWVTNGIYNGVPFYARLMSALKNLFFSAWLVILPGIPLIFTQKNKFARFSGYVGIFYLIIWGCFYSYDLRNGFLAWPFIIYSEMSGLEELVREISIEKIVKQMERISGFFLSRKGIVIIFCVLCLISLAAGKKFSKDYLISKQDSAKIHRGGEIGRFIDDFFKNNAFASDSLYLSNYQPLSWTSEKSYSRKNYVGFEFRDVESLRQEIDSSKIEYLCIDYGDSSPSIIEYFKEKKSTKIFKVIYTRGSVEFIHIEDFSKL